MYYRLSNTAGLDMIERTFDAPFKYPHIHTKNPIINGLEEESLPLIIDTHPNNIDYGIWGILPEGFKDEWEVYQKTQNTLNININSLNTSHVFSIDNRCVFVVSGFFFSYYHDGEIYPFYAHPKTNIPFGLAGIYNRTFDGFITASFLTTEISGEFAKYNNLSRTMPMIVPANNYMTWLNEDYIYLMDNKQPHEGHLDFVAHPIAKEFFKNDIVYHSILEPINYKPLSIQF